MSETMARHGTLRFIFPMVSNFVMCVPALVFSHFTNMSSTRWKWNTCIPPSCIVNDTSETKCYLNIASGVTTWELQMMNQCKWSKQLNAKNIIPKTRLLTQIPPKNHTDSANKISAMRPRVLICSVHLANHGHINPGCSLTSASKKETGLN